jgi:hypothetical protein
LLLRSRTSGKDTHSSVLRFVLENFGQKCSFVFFDRGIKWQDFDGGSQTHKYYARGFGRASPGTRVSPVPKQERVSDGNILLLVLSKRTFSIFLVFENFIDPFAAKTPPHYLSPAPTVRNKHAGGGRLTRTTRSSTLATSAVGNGRGLNRSGHRAQRLAMVLINK